MISKIKLLLSKIKHPKNIIKYVFLQVEASACFLFIIELNHKVM